MDNNNSITTIQISENLRIQLKTYCAEMNLTYEDFLYSLINSFENIAPFKRESEFRMWFKFNIVLFGYTEIIEDNEKSFPDFVMKKKDGSIERVELELVDISFYRHKHDINKVDKIICVYGELQNIGNVPVLNFMRDFKSSSRTVNIDDDILNQIRALVKKDPIKYPSCKNYVEQAVLKGLIEYENKEETEDKDGGA